MIKNYFVGRLDRLRILETLFCLDRIYENIS